MLRPLLLLFVLAAAPILLVAQSEADRYTLPRRVMPLEEALIRLTEAGADLSYRPDQLPRVAVRVPGGTRNLERWLQILLRGTEFSYHRGAAGYLILLDPHLHGRSFNLYGTVTDAQSGERLIGASIQAVSAAAGTQTNEYGFYTLPVEGGRQSLRVTYVGYFPLEVEFVLRSDSLLNLPLQPNLELPQIIVTATDMVDPGSAKLETGTRIGHAEVAQLGGPGGEDDPLQLARLLPGVTSGSDGVGGIFIRGSEAGHNLILLDGVPVYSLSHAGGLLSMFSNQAIRRIDLYKDAVPARFGGRIGGVLDVHTRDGNLYENEFTLGTTLLSSQVAAEGPIREGESSFLLTGRYFWAGRLLRQFSESYKANRGRSGHTDYDVYDLNFKLNQRAGKRGRVYLSLFRGVDDYTNLSYMSDTLERRVVGQTVFENAQVTGRQEQSSWSTTVAALRYNHVFNDRTFGNFRLSYSNLDTESAVERYDSLVERSQPRLDEGFIYSGYYASGIKQFGLAFDGQYSAGPAGTFRFGIEANAHTFTPAMYSGKVALRTFINEFDRQDDGSHRPLQFTAYGSQEGLFRSIHYRLGLRASVWRNTGRSYPSLSPRLVFSGPITASSDWQASYDRSVQPVHLLNSFIIGMPSDLWVPATADIAPATAQQWSSKWRKQLRGWKLEAGAYYKRMRNLVTYAEGSQTSTNWSSNLSQGRGRAYGLETMVQRSRGKLRGWLSYTLARSQRTFGREINQGETFPFRYDRRHAINLLLIYQLGERTTLTGSWRFETGLAYSLSTEVVENPLDPVGPDLPIVERRNGFRLKPNHRLDLNLHTVLSKPDSKFTHAIDVGLYNTYNRRNPVYYETQLDYSVVDNQPVSTQNYFQIYVAPVLPSLSYQLTFGSGPPPDFGR
ncbi:Vitamin B12 transporter BtuB [Neolewinella maritima]|uniref:Vitamin B12 transporter BtuB n=1 Tax=Neolewinella maritima TaxID=1383882 RepID=A0ABN8F5I7_9BACT|nr:carboxypeptidase-like regulatory domain-containing protein [Neolewinella maritima]CAH1000202.1 Vitamin B12 transporter BtuB [Neolewinella maritima]